MATFGKRNWKNTGINWLFIVLLFQGCQAQDKKSEKNIEVIQQGIALGSESLTVWLADGSCFPGQLNFRKAYQNTLESLEEIYVCLELFGYEHSLPTARFYEDQESLGGALTAVGIILPIEIYELAASMRGIQYDPFSEGITPTTRNFINALNKCGLAN